MENKIKQLEQEAEYSKKAREEQKHLFEKLKKEKLLLEEAE